MTSMPLTRQRSNEEDEAIYTINSAQKLWNESANEARKRQRLKRSENKS